jgi:hypothetical protein
LSGKNSNPFSIGAPIKLVIFAAIPGFSRISFALINHSDQIVEIPYLSSCRTNLIISGNLIFFAKRPFFSKNVRFRGFVTLI